MARKTPITLIASLNTKLNELDAKSDAKHREAADLATLAAEAKAEAETATLHAIAVEKAADILTEAGVTL